MKRLTINRIAGAGLRANRRAYASLALGIFLSIFLVSVLCLSAQGILLARKAQVAARVGWEDAFLLDSDLTDQQIRETGHFNRIGHLYVTAQVTDVDTYLGHYDADGAALMNRRCIEGRLPEVPGEIAMERSAIELMRMEANVGDVITLALTPIDGLPESREFTLVGILNEQGSQLRFSSFVYSTGKLFRLPAILTCPEEPAFASGRTVMHRAMTLNSGVNLNSILKLNIDHKLFPGDILIGINSWGEPYWFVDDAMLNALSQAMDPILILTWMLGGSLLLATCVGIASALESQLLRKTEEIGMLRAVGATRRQIRRIFGREAWLLALIVSPLSVLAGVLFAWGLSRAFPDQLIFRPTPSILIPILILSATIVLIASRLPLRRASRILPSQIMRNTGLLYKARRIRTQRQFSMPRLIARRQFTLHPLRHVGSSLLVGLMLVVIGLSVIGGTASYGDWTSRGEFALQSKTYSQLFGFLNALPRTTLSDGDLAQLSALPLVERADATRVLWVNLMLDEVADYFKYDDEFPIFATRYLNDDYPDTERKSFSAAQRALETAKYLVPMNFTVLDVDAMDWADHIAEGKIDLDALDSGREVLVYGPDYYFDGAHVSPIQFPRWQSVRRSDYFHTGQTLSLAHLWKREGDDPSSMNSYEEDDYDALYASAESKQFDISVGAVLNGYLDGFWAPSFITTEDGAKALGLNVDYIERVSIHLSATPDEAGEEALESRIETIAMRGNMGVANRLKDERDAEEERRQLVFTLAAVAIVLLAVSVSLIAGNVTRRIRADARMIGTLRAVGADARSLTRSYTYQVAMSIVLGLICGVLLLIAMLFLSRLNGEYFTLRFFAALSIAIAAFTALILLSCFYLLRRSIRESTRRSIIENIREL